MALTDTIEGQEFVREQPVGCPLCGEQNEPNVFEGRFGMTVAIAECKRDRIAYQSPRPSAEASRAYMNMRWRSADKYVADEAFQRQRAEQQFARVADLAPVPGRLLDFGAGVGTFAGVARSAGWDVSGVESSAEAVRRAHDDHGVGLTSDIPDGTFDVITLWDVIEHVRDPAGMLVQLASSLAPRGLMVIETGNWECWQRLHARHDWTLFLLDHQFYFSPASLLVLLQQAGLDDLCLLDVGHARPRRRPSIRRAAIWARAWAAYAEAKRRWNGHHDIEVMIATARLRP
jgi:SAM-dependent methyltransferase